jgi:nitroreductase
MKYFKFVVMSDEYIRAAKEVLNLMEIKATESANPKALKKLAIAKEIISLSDNLVNFALYNKKKPRFVRRNKYSRKKAIMKKTFLAVQARMTYANVLQIQSQPIRIFKLAACHKCKRLAKKSFC